MTQGLSVTISRKNNSESMNINFRLNPNAHINSYVIYVYKRSQSTMKQKKYLGLVACFKFAPRMWFVISVRLGRNGGNLNAKYMSTRINENNKVSVKKRIITYLMKLQL